jgi:hypothetical protein
MKILCEVCGSQGGGYEDVTPYDLFYFKIGGSMFLQTVSNFHQTV